MKLFAEYLSVIFTLDIDMTHRTQYDCDCDYEQLEFVG